MMDDSCRLQVGTSLGAQGMSKAQGTLTAAQYQIMQGVWDAGAEGADKLAIGADHDKKEHSKH